MGYFQVMYDSRVVNYEHKLFIRLATDPRCVLSGFDDAILSVFPIVSNIS